MDDLILIPIIYFGIGGLFGILPFVFGLIKFNQFWTFRKYFLKRVLAWPYYVFMALTD